MKTCPAALVAAFAGLAGCFSHDVHVDPIEVKPIHVTVDVNVKIQRELDKFFDFETPTDSKASDPKTTDPQRKEQR